jgi:hypothetical protein
VRVDRDDEAGEQLHHLQLQPRVLRIQHTLALAGHACVRRQIGLTTWRRRRRQRGLLVLVLLLPPGTTAHVWADIAAAAARGRRTMLLCIGAQEAEDLLEVLDGHGEQAPTNAHDRHRAVRGGGGAAVARRFAMDMGGPRPPTVGRPGRSRCCHRAGHRGSAGEVGGHALCIGRGTHQHQLESCDALLLLLVA